MRESEDTQEDWESRLYMRVSRLRRLVELDAPSEIIAHEKENVVKAILYLEPRNLALVLGNLAKGMAEADAERDRKH
jgi:hypothetical protein